MREYNEKKARGGFGISRVGSNLASRNLSLQDESIKCCNRLGCSTRYYSPNGTETSSSPKTKNPKASFLSLSSKAIYGKSSILSTFSSYSRKSKEERREPTSFQDIKNVKRRSKQVVSEDLESSNSQEEIGLPDAESVESTACNRFKENLTEASANSERKSRSRFRMEVKRQLEGGSQFSSSSSSSRPTIASRNISHANKNALEVSRNAIPKSGSRNMTCALVSDGHSGSSSSDSGHNRNGRIERKRPSEGQSSFRGQNIKSSIGGYSSSRFRGHSALSLLPPERRISQQTLRKATNRSTYRDGTGLHRKRQTPTGEARLWVSDQEEDISLTLAMSDVTSELPQIELSLFDDVPEYSTRYGQLGSSSRTAHNRHVDVQGIPEVLLVLERFERNEELTYEELLVLEANFPLVGLTFHDRHREMRLDIDNMSYEELLALEEKIGSVSTALTEEALSRCLKKSIISLVPGINSLGDDDTKCSICQEEYVIGEEIGELECYHRYHVTCIHQWLGKKNWCPICKASACSS